MNQCRAGIIISYITVAARSIIGLLYVPMLLYYLTQSQFGVYQLMGSIVAYLSVMEFGLANTTTRYVARALSLKDFTQMQRVIATSHTIYLGIAAIVFLLGSILYFFIDPVYSQALTAEELHTAKQIYIIMIINMVVMIQGNIFTSVINAHQRFVFVQGLNLLKIVIQPLLVWAILAWKASALNVVLAQSVVIWGGIFVNYVYCKKKLDLSFPFQLQKTPLFLELTGFSFFIFLHIVMDQVYYRSGQIILGAVSGAEAVAKYAIAIQVLTFSISIPAAVNEIFLPRLSASVATQGNLDEVNTLFCKLGRLQFMLFALIVIGFIFVGKVFLILWVGPEYNIVYWLVLTLMAGYAIDVSQSLGSSVLQAMKKHAFRAYIYTAMAALNIGLAIPLSKYYGEMGCAFSTFLCLCLGPGLAMNLYYKHLGVDIKTFFKNAGKLLLPILLSVFCITVLFSFWVLQPNALSFILHGLAVVGIYACIMWFGGFNSYERGLVSQPICKILKIISPKKI